MRHGPRALAVAAACFFAPAAASAQSCPTCDTCGPRVGNSYSGAPGRHCNAIYPRLESRYIKQFCGPHLSPDACFGYFRTRVTAWGQACPNYGGHEAPATGPGSVQAAAPAAAAPPSIPPAAPLPAAKPADVPVPPVPVPVPDAAPKPPGVPLPKVDVPRVPN